MKCKEGYKKVKNKCVRKNIFNENSVSKTYTYRIGPGFLGLLTILFITLKLTGVINWSWWLILLPLYGPILLGIIIFIIFLIIVWVAKR